jgi:sec-independent protein translocase protein TatB
MFNVGGGELLVIMLIALIVLGPQRLPDAARQVGRVMGDLRRISSGFQQELKDAFDDGDAPTPLRRKEAVPLASTVAEADKKPERARGRDTAAASADAPVDADAADTPDAAAPAAAPAPSDQTTVAPAVAAALDEVVTALDPSPGEHTPPAGATPPAPGDDALGDERAAS